MKPLISRAQFDRIAAGLPEAVRDAIAANVEIAPDAPERVVDRALLDRITRATGPKGEARAGLNLDHGWMVRRFNELFAQQGFRDRLLPGRMARVTAPRYGSGPGHAWATDETNAELFRRWQAVVAAFNGGRQSGKTEAMRRFADEAERLTGVRPAYARADVNGDLVIAEDGTTLRDAAEWMKVCDALDSPPAQWLDADEFAASLMQDSSAAAKQERRRFRLNGQEPEPDPRRLRELRRAVREDIEQLADRTGTPRHLLPFDDDDD